MLDVTGVHFRGVIFDERGKQAIRNFTEQTTRAVTDAGYDIVYQLFRQRIQHGTGYFLSHLDTEISGTYGRVHDSMIIYGLWLEGIGSRNATTRFKGYHAWRDGAVILNTRTEQIIAPLEAQLERELNY